MTQFNWDGLNPEFSDKCRIVLEKVKEQGILIKPYSGLRTVEDQAKLWRKGRTLREINQKISDLKSHNCNYLANLIINADPQAGDKTETDAIPGLSWHNWGYALDCVVYINNDPTKPDWDGWHPNYRVYADLAAEEGLTSGLYFNGKFKDPDHIQMYNKEILSIYTLQYVNDYFQSRKD